MAEVLKISYGELDNPITEANSGYYYNGYVYVNTATKIYRVDVINNRAEEIYIKPRPTDFFSLGHNGKLYIFYLTYTHGITTSVNPTTHLNINVYDIENNTYTTDIVSFNNSGRGLYRYHTSLCGIIINDILYCSFGGYNTEVVTQYNNFVWHSIQYDLNSGNGKYLNQLSTQLSPDVFKFSQQTYFKEYVPSSNPLYTFFRNWGSTEADYIVTPNLKFKETSSFAKNGLMYIIGGKYNEEDNYKIYTYDFNSNILTETPYELSQSISQRFCIEVGSDYYIFTDSGYIKISYKNYDLQYEIKSPDGSITYAVHTNSAPITKILFRFDGSNVSYILTTEAGEIVGNYTPNIIEKKILIGYSGTPKSTMVYFELNKEINVNINNNYTFYEVYNDYKPLPKSFQVYLYKNSAEPNRLDKTNYLELVDILEGAFRETTSITKPIITIQQTELPQFNYVYIPLFNRYYYVNDITSIRYGLWDLSLFVDVLMSFKDGILECSGFVDRNEFIYNENIIDSKVVIEQGYNVEETTIENELFDSGLNDFSFVLNGFAIQSV